MSLRPKHIYRRVLPETCIAFASSEGKQLFTEALHEGNANIFFKLSSHFRTQDDTSFCGLASLGVDSWRFYHESMLDCCVPVETVKKEGTTLPQISCLARCNRLNSELHHATESEESISSLRRDVIRSVKSDDVVLLASYHRGVLSQTGTGHFSPIAAYHAKSDMVSPTFAMWNLVLLLDVARFKYPPHWVDLRLLHAAMCSVDEATEKTRGYLMLSLVPKTRPLLTFGLQKSTTSTEQQIRFAECLVAWNNFLSENPLKDDSEELALTCRRFSECFTDFDLSCKRSESSCPKQCSNVETCDLEVVKSVTSETTFPAEFLQSTSIAALLFAFPFDVNGNSYPDQPVTARASRLIALLDEERNTFSNDTLNEIDLLRQQISTVIGTCKLSSMSIDH